jgi:hypothetical protein
MLTSSGLVSSASAVTVRSSSAIPHRGHTPGPLLTTSGCMGQVYSVAAAIGAAAAGGATYFSGFSPNRRAHPGAQKWKVWPPCSMVAAAFSGSIVMPHTGSVTVISVSA